ncbi:hypothetical protein SODALDRAFT_330655 [Sodiomyces alkalinus F11]|uniref:Uncharacterized protein n=1 Tax=Sodiomyces alkalinus (strain CBS 110278 / VKM F-3762 / F11) TaxID=1314773 RepID=A0A3N2Q2D4_SODAK|nr:hypothetical protein SODALDRAFT_330655 [Sodiomyces alkalinus F11]ROT40929.1 hypothetical protein SODALDRAFT_330655 [Sodiomyces alkalinus F11]
MMHVPFLSPLAYLPLLLIIQPRLLSPRHPPLTIGDSHLRLQAMHQGVIRDMEQQRIKRERQLDFEMQRALEEEYKKEQTVRDTTAAGPQRPGLGSQVGSASPTET